MLTSEWFLVMICECQSVLLLRWQGLPLLFKDILYLKKSTWHTFLFNRIWNTLYTLHFYLVVIHHKSYNLMDVSQLTILMNLSSCLDTLRHRSGHESLTLTDDSCNGWCICGLEATEGGSKGDSALWGIGVVEPGWLRAFCNFCCNWFGDGAM